MSVEYDLNKIGSREKNDQHGDLKNSAQFLYKNYKTWVKLNKPNEKPLSFKDWIKWAKSKGIVKGDYSADASYGVDDKITMVPEVTQKPVTIVKNTGRTIAKAFIWISIIGIVLSFVKFGKGGEEGDGGESANV